MWRQAKNKAERYKTEWTCVDEVQTHANPKRKKKSNNIEMKWKMSGVNERDRSNENEAADDIDERDERKENKLSRCYGLIFTIHGLYQMRCWLISARLNSF